MKQLLLQITYKFTNKTYSQYPQVSSEQAAKTTTASFVLYFIKLKKIKDQASVQDVPRSFRSLL